MALIECPECSELVSNLAESCPKCGAHQWSARRNIIEKRELARIAIVNYDKEKKASRARIRKW
jgi:RNA polymerase subunit RPABC4/transcription elongation factor Spt4